MAEFQDVMRNWKRMCKHYWHGDEDVDCSLECPLYGVWCPMMDEPIKDVDQIESDRLEAVVTVWAEMHPEPKYPTWYDWLSKLAGGEVIILTQPIPAEVAEKLGVEPLED